MKLPKGSIDRIREAFEAIDLGDPRRQRRLDATVAKMAEKPAASLPRALGTNAKLEAAYRLANNEAVNPQELFDAFGSTTAKRAAAAGAVLAIHDTTTCGFPNADPDEIGYLPTGKAGFFVHCTLVIEDGAWRRPLGIAHVETISRKKQSKRGRKNKASGKETATWKDRESLRWQRGVENSAAVLADCKRVCHIADREGDSYALLASMVTAGHSFVVRVNHDRKVGDPDDLVQQWVPLKQRVRALQGMIEREVALSERKRSPVPRRSKSHPVRRARVANLTFTATTVLLKRPRYLCDPIPKNLTLGVVHVIETDPPSGEQPVEWLLFTTLPVQSVNEVEKVVDNYRARWTIEEFNKALKTGCAYENREFQSLHALLVVLAMTLPIACELLWLRSRARTHEKSPATDVLTPQQLHILRVLGSYKLPREPTARDALWAVATLGGHLKRNGEPGWLVLYRGMEDLLTYQAGYQAGLEAKMTS